jgi:hypothetical protein
MFARSPYRFRSSGMLMVSALEMLTLEGSQHESRDDS